MIVISASIPTKTCQPKYFSMVIPPLVAHKIINPAIIFPKVIDKKALLNGILNKKAIKEVVQPPVKGKGRATKTVKAKRLALLNLTIYFFLVFSKSHEKKIRKILNFWESQMEIGSKNKSRKTTAIEFPTTEIKKAETQFI